MAYTETQGTTLGRGDGSSPESYTTVGQVVSITSIGQSRSLIDVTNLASTAREYKMAIKDGLELSFTIQYDPTDTQQTGLRSDMDNATVRSFQITFADDSPSATATFNALVTNWSLDAEIDQVVQGTVTLKPTGDFTWANG